MKISEIRKAIGQIGRERKDLAARLEEAKQRREFLQTAPLPKDELVTSLCSLIDRDAARYSSGLKRSIEGMLRKPFYDWRASHFNLLGSCNGVTHQDDRIPRPLLAFAFNDLLKQAMRRAVDEWSEYPEPGPPMAERRREIEQLDAEIEDLTNKIAEIDRETDQAGIKRLES